MDMQLLAATPADRDTLANLLEKYEYEFSQWTRLDVDDRGLFGYPWLDCYWTEPNRWPFLITVEGKLAGFALVSDWPELPREPLDYAMGEFFILHKYRRCGVGRFAATTLFQRFPGRWQLKRHPANLASVRFWDAVVGSCTGGNYRVLTGEPGTEYEDGTPGEILLFDTSTASHSKNP